MGLLVLQQFTGSDEVALLLVYSTRIRFYEIYLQ